MAGKVLSLTIDAALVGERIDRALAQLPEISSRSRAAKLIDLGLVKLNDRRVKASHKTSLGEVFTVELPPPQPSGLVAYDFPLEVYFEDEQLLVLNKPAGLVVHPAAGHAADTLVNALIHHAKDLSMGFAEDRPGIVHRLDKDTSGLLVVAKNDLAQEALARQFKEHTTHRIYWAITFGQPANPSGTITSYLRRHPTDRKRFASEKMTAGKLPQGKRAVTHYQLLQSHSSGLSLIKCRLETGRTHQIRVHLSEMGLPLIGDRLYGAAGRATGLRNTELRAAINGLQRIGLHAAELGFTHPTLGERLLFRAPWPEDLLTIVRLLQWD